MTEQEFYDRVKTVERRRPDHPLLPLLRQHSNMAEIYLKHAMKGLPKEQEARPQVQWKVPKMQSSPDSPEWEALQRKKGSLYARRANLSNQFHLEPENRLQCANISDEIREIQRKISTVQRQESHYLRTGEMKEEPQEVAREYAGVALSRRYRTVQQNINRWRSRITREGPSAPASELAKWEKKLKAYEREFDELKGQIRQETV